MTATTTLTHKQHRQIDRDYRKAARAANLVYVTDNQEGIRRIRKGKAFTYTYQGKVVKDRSHLDRIRSLVIPPAWENVWICHEPAGHIQVTGIDANGRKQYKYHPGWNELRNQTKFHRLYEFGHALPKIRRRLKKDLEQPGLTEEKVLATVIQLMEQTYIRIGNNGYEKLYGSYGLTTLKDKHVEVGSEKISFSFRGKKGIDHSITIRNKKLARVVKQCRDVPGKELFQYYDADGNKKSIDSGKVNSYIKAAADDDFSAKDFRTWAGTLKALEFFCQQEMEEPVTPTTIKKNIVAALDAVSEKLGNTRTVCRKYYVHPELIRLYEENQLTHCLSKPPSKGIPSGLAKEEKSLLHILKLSMVS